MPLKKIIDSLVEQELEEVNSIAAGGVGTTGGSPLGMDMGPQHKTLWSGDKDEKRKKKKSPIQEREENYKLKISQRQQAGLPTKQMVKFGIPSFQNYTRDDLEEKILENVLDKMGLEKATDNVRRGALSGEVYMDRHDNNKKDTKRVMGMVAKNLNKKAYSHDPPTTGLRETKYKVDQNSMKYWEMANKVRHLIPGDAIYATFNSDNPGSISFAISDALTGNRKWSFAEIHPGFVKIFDVRWKTSPYYAEFFKTLNDWVPGVSGAKIITDEEDSGFTVGQVAQAVKVKDVKSHQYRMNRFGITDEEPPTFDEFKVHIFEDLDDRTWYHATLKKNLASIQTRGLVPSGEFDQGGGWTELNLNLQNAVYLTGNIDYAYGIAETLTDRFGEVAVVLAVSGKALQDKSKITLDEDAIRGSYEGMLDWDKVRSDIPNYYSSVAHEIESIGYMGVIPASFISVEDETLLEVPDADS